MKTKTMVHAALGTALISVCAWITVQLPMTLLVPFTLQTFAVVTVAGLLSLKAGTLSVLVYILLGAVGVPVFSGFRGGLSVLAGATGGYIVGFLLTAVVVGALTGRFGQKLLTLILVDVLGLSLCYLFGSVWFMAYTKSDLAYTLSSCVVIFLIPEAIKIVVSSLLVNRLGKAIKR